MLRIGMRREQQFTFAELGHDTTSGPQIRRCGPPQVQDDLRRSILPRDGRDHVRRMPPLRQYCEPDRDLHKLLEGLLTIDPDRRLTAKDALSTCAFLERC